LAAEIAETPEAIGLVRVMSRPLGSGTGPGLRPGNSIQARNSAWLGVVHYAHVQLTAALDSGKAGDAEAARLELIRALRSIRWLQ